MGVDFRSMLEASFYSTSRIIFIALCGYLLVRFKIINKQVMKGIAEMTANFLIPCLSVAEICKSFHIKNYEIWVPILIYCVFNVGMGYFIGELICFCMKPIKPEIRRLVLIVCMFSNSTSMQLIYVECLGPILGKMINTTEVEAKSKGYVIVLIYTIFVNFLRWSIGYNLMKPDKKDYVRANENSNKSSPVHPRELGYKEEKLQILDDGRLNILNENQEENINSNASSSSTCLKVIKEGINMPFIAGLAAIVLSSIPYVNTFFSNPQSVGFKLLVDPCEAVGKCVSTFVILILGLNLSLSLKDTGSNSSNTEENEPLSKKIIFSVLFTKAVVFPLLGLFSVWFVGYQTKILTDPLLCFLLLTNFCTPTAINMVTIAIINKFQITNLSKILIYQYIMGIITVTIWTAIYMNLFITS